MKRHYRSLLILDVTETELDSPLYVKVAWVVIIWTSSVTLLFLVAMLVRAVLK